MKPLQFHLAAVEEAEAAVLWYGERSKSASSAFLAELERAFEFIPQRPETWPASILGTLRFLLRRFPFAIVYRVSEESIQIVAVAHGKRRPGYWKKR